jgi:hypothetical protein
VISPEAEAEVFQLNDAAASWRDIDGEIVALDIESGAYLTLNGSGRLLWLALVQPSSVQDLSALLVSTFDIPTELADADARTFVDDLAARKLIEAVA